MATEVADWKARGRKTGLKENFLYNHNTALVILQIALYCRTYRHAIGIALGGMAFLFAGVGHRVGDGFGFNLLLPLPGCKSVILQYRPGGTTLRPVSRLKAILR
jgi:hypothetical protein